jgi:hypothetical protein
MNFDLLSFKKKENKFATSLSRKVNILGYVKNFFIGHTSFISIDV